MTNREAHEAAAGMSLTLEFFVMNGIDPDAEYREVVNFIPNQYVPRGVVVCHPDTCEELRKRFGGEIL